MNSGLKIQTILPFIDENRSGMAWEIPNFQIEFLSTYVDFYQQDSFCFIYVRCFLSFDLLEVRFPSSLIVSKENIF